MKCPNCGKPLTLPELMKIAVWAEYKCPNCHKVSKRPKQNQMLSLLVIVAIPFMDRLLLGTPFWISTAVIVLVSYSALVLLAVAFGQLALVEN